MPRLPSPADGSGAPSPEGEHFWRSLPSQSLTPPDVLAGRFPILDVRPAVESGRRPAKAVVGEAVTVRAVIFREGHDSVSANVVLRDQAGKAGPWTPMIPVADGEDHWHGTVRPDAEGEWTFTIEAWSDPVGTWRHRAEIKIPAGVDVELEFEEGARVLERALAALPAGADAKPLRAAIKTLRGKKGSPADRLAAALTGDLARLLEAHPLRDLVTECGPWPLRVDRRRALVGAWYEMFPRSEGSTIDPPKSGTFRKAAKRLPAIADMCFDVVYLPPIHPIGQVNRKGRNNTLDPAPGDPGSPWAVGSADGGHESVHPDLGTLTDFDAFVAAARKLDLEVALDLALQVAPDHPWVTAGRPWFTVRADGSIAYAENPPKKYQDIYPMWFDGDPDGIYHEVLRIIRFWAERGIRIFRVDNPHTKPVRFWDAVLNEVRRTDPDILFLGEAFTSPAMMRALAEVGFHQNYTYFTWRNEKWELEKYLAQLSWDTSPYLRPNFFVNTPDILSAYLQYGGPAAFAIRATLAATMSPSWGVYSGFELYEHVALRPGSEEYLDGEKYQYRPRDWAGAAKSGRTLAPYITLLNQIRRKHPALQTLRDISLHGSDNDRVIAFSKRDGDDVAIIVCTLDPYGAQEATISLDMAALGLGWQDSFLAHDEVTGGTWLWSQRNYVRLDPYQNCAHIITVRRGTV